MKKILILIMMFLVLVSCSGQNDVDPVVYPLDEPVLQFDSNTNLVSWNPVEDATYYNYIINDGEILSTTALSIEIENQQTISVQAANNENCSEWSNAVTCYDTSDIYLEAKKDIYVKFHNTNLESKKISTGSKIEKPIAPSKEYYTFDDWYADPYYQELFDFNQPLYSSTIIYANYIPNDLINNTTFWIKGDPNMSSTIMSSGTSSNWHFIPLKENKANTSFKEFFATVTVTSASATTPCCFIVMDGFSNDTGRTYWKNNGSDFSITESGTYNIYFSIEHEYAKDIYAYVEKINNVSSTALSKNNNLTLDTPVVSVDSDNNIASWNSVSKATKYEVIIDNNEVVETTSTSIQLNKKSFITVRAIYKDKYSSWSIPKANINHILVDSIKEYCSVYFVGFDAYQVKINDLINEVPTPEKENFTFGGWYLDIACTKVAEFPYEITENTVFYPKWTSNDDYENKIYFNLISSDGTIISGLKWNLDNYTFIEYETEVVTLSTNTEYYIVSTTDSSVKYGPYKVDKTCGYIVYFSEDHNWDNDRVYFSSQIKTFYFSAPAGWTDTIYAYIWNSKTGKIYEYWPGSQMQYVETNGYGQKIYKIDVDMSLYNYIIFTHGSNGSATGSQSIDISLEENSSNGFYLTEKDSSGKYNFGTYSR